eukprot:TRINITY_DN6916_c0_g1_i1.p1 TRINITY_DN6916_c0_g1~~TRINITY_DN6916_c0_g1_i1.p1  ORF type:complete len:265 (+),score=29.02 TRINITY_DN6916_c0_g1_i1:1167-1961(+)
MEGIAYLTNLSQLSLYFYSMHEVTDSGLAHILRIIPSLPHLKSLSLGLVGCVKVTDETLDAICTALQVKADLHGLALLLNGTGVTNGGILRLSRFLPYLPNVKEFTIDVEMVSEGSCVELANNIQNLTSLKTLRLRLSSSKEIGDLTLKSISVALQSHRNLSNVDLDFSNTGVNDEGVVAIGNQLSQLSQLTYFKLSLAKTRVSDVGAMSIIRGLQSLQQLTHVRLDFLDCYKMLSKLNADKVEDLLRVNPSIAVVNVQLEMDL